MKSLLKAVQIYNIDDKWSFDGSVIKECLSKHASKRLGRMDMKNIGWDTFENGEQIIMSRTTCVVRIIEQKKVVPPAVIKEALKKEIAKYEAHTGHPPKAKEKQNMKDSILMQILPRALEVSKCLYVLIDTAKKKLYIEASSAKAADDLAIYILQTLNMNIMPVRNDEMVTLMTNWMIGDDTGDSEFHLGDSCSLESADEKSSKVKFTKVDLNADECKQHINLGYRVFDIEMYIDECVNFTINKDICIKKISFDDMFADDEDSSDEFNHILFSMEIFIDAINKIEEKIF